MWFAGPSLRKQIVKGRGHCSLQRAGPSSWKPEPNTGIPHGGAQNFQTGESAVPALL